MNKPIKLRPLAGLGSIIRATTQGVLVVIFIAMCLFSFTRLFGAYVQRMTEEAAGERDVHRISNIMFRDGDISVVSACSESEHWGFLPPTKELDVWMYGCSLMRTGSSSFSPGGLREAWRFAGMRLYDDPETSAIHPGKTYRWIFIMPGWPVALLLGIAPAFWFRRWVIDRRIRQRLALGQCASCGYDLRASAGRCPECGVAIPAGSG